MIIAKIQEVLSKCDFVNGLLVNGRRETILFLFSLSVLSGLFNLKERMSILLEKIIKERITK